MTETNDGRDPQKVAEETSRRIQPDDPYTEPPNSTVDDWLGQRVAREMENAPEPDEAEKAMREADVANGEGDPDAPGNFVHDADDKDVPEPNEPG